MSFQEAAEMRWSLPAPPARRPPAPFSLYCLTDAKEKGATHFRGGAVGLDAGYEDALPPAEPLVVAVNDGNTEIGGGRLLQRHLPPSREALEFGTGKYLEQCMRY